MSGSCPALQSLNGVAGIFVWGRAKDDFQPTSNEDGVLQVAAQLHHTTRAPVYIPGYNGEQCGQGPNGYPGPGIWQRELQVFGVASEAIVPLLTPLGNVPSGIQTTKTEFEDFLLTETAHADKWYFVVTAQWHALRAMLGAVHSMETHGKTLFIAPVWPTRIDWNRMVYGSQGRGPKPRAEWLQEEYAKIPRYQKKGDLATTEELLAYLQLLYSQLA